MFFGVQIVGKKRPLSSAWLRGCGRKITKKKVMKENILQTCDMIMQPEVPLALRLSAVLMSGVIQIFHQKQAYILEDCHGALRSARARAKAAEDKVAASMSTMRGAKSGLSKSRGAATATARTEDTITFRSHFRDAGAEETVHDVSKHVEEIFLQEFLSTQPHSNDLAGLSIDKRSLEFFTPTASDGSGSGSKGNRNNNKGSGSGSGSGSGARRAQRSRSFGGGYDLAAPGLSGSGSHGHVGGLPLDPHSIDHPADDFGMGIMGEDTFLHPNDSDEGAGGAAPGVFHEDDLMKDFFFTTGSGDGSDGTPLGSGDSPGPMGGPPHSVSPEMDDNGGGDEPHETSAATGANLSEVAAKAQKPKRKRKRRTIKILNDGSCITLPRETIREWLKDATDIICTRPVFERSRGGLRAKKMKKNESLPPPALLRHACSELLELFAGPEETAQGKPRSESPPEAAAVDFDMVDSGSGEREASPIEYEVLRQQDDPSLSPNRVSEAVFHSSSSEEGEGLGLGPGSDEAGEEFVPDAAPFLQTLPELQLPPTDEFVLPETNEMSQFGDPSNRQYENISFTPLRLPTQSQDVNDNGSPHNYSSEASQRVLHFYRQEKERGEAEAIAEEEQDRPLCFSDVMRAHSIKRSDVARIFFHSLVLEAHGHLEMTQENRGPRDRPIFVHVM